MTFAFSKMSPDARGRFGLIIMESRMLAASETLLFISLATACKSWGEFCLNFKFWIHSNLMLLWNRKMGRIILPDLFLRLRYANELFKYCRSFCSSTVALLDLQNEESRL